MISNEILRNNFTIVSNELANDGRISGEAKAVMLWLLSKPRDWIVRQDGIRRQFGWGRERVQAIMRQLIATGWARMRPKFKDARGAYAGGDYVIFNRPQPVAQGAPAEGRDAPGAAEPPVASANQTGDESAEPESGPPGAGKPTTYLEGTLPRTDSSEPKGSGPGKPAPERKIVFEQGRISLGALGVARRTAGDVIARWLKDTDNDTGKVLGAIQRAVDHGARSPIPFISACLQTSPSHVAADRNADQHEAFGDVAAWLRKLEAARNSHP